MVDLAVNALAVVGAASLAGVAVLWWRGGAAVHHALDDEGGDDE